MSWGGGCSYRNGGLNGGQGWAGSSGCGVAKRPWWGEQNHHEVMASICISQNLDPYPATLLNVYLQFLKESTNNFLWKWRRNGRRIHFGSVHSSESLGSLIGRKKAAEFLEFSTIIFVVVVVFFFFSSFFLFLIEVGGWWLDCKKVVLDALALGTVIMEEFPGAPSLGGVWLEGQYIDTWFQGHKNEKAREAACYEHSKPLNCCPQTFALAAYLFFP